MLRCGRISILGATFVTKGTKMPQTVKLVVSDPAVIYACQLRAIDYAANRRELIDIYKASKKVFGYSLPLFMIVTAIRARIGHFQVEEI